MISFERVCTNDDLALLRYTGRSVRKSSHRFDSKLKPYKSSDSKKCVSVSGSYLDEEDKKLVGLMYIPNIS